MAVLDAGTGAVRWWDHRPTDHPHSTVAIDRYQGILLCGSNDGYCYAWEFPSLDRAWRYDTGAEVKAPIAISDGTAIVPSWAETVTGIDISDGTQLWEFEADDMLMCAPAVQDGVAYVGSHDSNVYAIDIETGDLVWERSTGGLVTGNAVATNEHVLVGSYDSSLYALDQADGSTAWSFEGEGEVTGAAAVTEDAVYFTERAKYGRADYPGMLYKLRPA